MQWRLYLLIILFFCKQVNKTPVLHLFPPKPKSGGVYTTQMTSWRPPWSWCHGERAESLIHDWDFSFFLKFMAMDNHYCGILPHSWGCVGSQLCKKNKTWSLDPTNTTGQCTPYWGCRKGLVSQRTVASLFHNMWRVWTNNIQITCTNKVWYVHVIWFVFYVLQLLPSKFNYTTNLCCISKSTMKHPQNIDWE